MREKVTGKTIRELFQKAGYKIDRIKSTMGKEVRIIDYLTIRVFTNFLSYRYFVVAKKS